MSADYNWDPTVPDTTGGKWLLRQGTNLSYMSIRYDVYINDGKKLKLITSLQSYLTFKLPCNFMKSWKKGTTLVNIYIFHIYIYIKPVNPKGNQPWTLIGKTNADTAAPVLWPPDVKSRVTGKDPDAGNDWRQKEKRAAEGEMAWPIQWTCTWALFGS